MSIDPIHVDLVMDKPVYGGDCLGHAADLPEKAGKAVFVPLTLPGERIRAQLIQDKRTFSRAEIDTVLSPSPHRIAAACRHFSACGGCHYQHTDDATQLEMKQLILRETLSRSGIAVQKPERGTIAIAFVSPSQAMDRLPIAAAARMT
jgi:23S rRNA (uracil1939-C5)-methyltransferase